MLNLESMYVWTSSSRCDEQALELPAHPFSLSLSFYLLFPNPEQSELADRCEWLCLVLSRELANHRAQSFSTIHLSFRHIACTSPMLDGKHCVCMYTLL